VLLPKGILPSLWHHWERIRTRGTAGLSGTRRGAADALSVRDRPTAPDPSELAARLEAAPPILEVEGLSKSFGGNQAVKDCTFTVPEGSITGLIGPNGSGKTTVFNLISGTLLPDAGTVRIGGTDISRMPSWGRAHRGLGRTFQSTRLFKEMSVLENIAAPLGSFSFPQMGLDAVSGREAERARELLDFVGLSRYEQAKAGSLSYGQQKLVELAQVLVLDPKLILLDEPAGGINPTLIERMGDLIRDLNAQGKTFLLVEHNMPFVLGLCNPVRVLAQGHVIATGSPDEIQKDVAVIDAYLGDDYLLDSDNSATRRMAVEGSAS
jgi:ABC-type branched-subunit amino acid transport system ATPase component